MRQHRPHYFIREVDGTVRPCDDALEWSRWFERDPPERFIERTEVSADIEVSTVFLGLDHGYGMEEQPVLFETMVFRRLPQPKKRLIGDGQIDFEGAEMFRWCTEADARRAHAIIVAWLRLHPTGPLRWDEAVMTYDSRREPS